MCFYKLPYGGYYSNRGGENTPMGQIMEIKMNDFYETNDFYLGCYLKTCGFKLSDIKHDGRRSTFVFEDNSKRKEMIKAFYNDEFVSGFIHAVQDLKAAVFNM